jgi:hypothetical protein
VHLVNLLLVLVGQEVLLEEVQVKGLRQFVGAALVVSIDAIPELLVIGTARRVKVPEHLDHGLLDQRVVVF